ncbi:MAG: methyltransferase domain-containing protein [archaeon]
MALVFRGYGGFAWLYACLRFMALPPAFLNRASGKVLDVGCGFGQYSLFLAARGCRVTGIDMNEQRIGIARNAAKKMGLDAEFMAGRIEDVRGRYDTIIMVDLLHHVERQPEVLRQCRKRLAKGGVLIVKEVDVRPRHKYMINYLQDKLITGGRAFYRSSGEMMNLLRGAGFSVRMKRISHPVYAHVLFVCRTE